MTKQLTDKQIVEYQKQAKKLYREGDFSKKEYDLTMAWYKHQRLNLRAQEALQEYNKLKGDK